MAEQTFALVFVLILPDLPPPAASLTIEQLRHCDLWTLLRRQRNVTVHYDRLM